MNQKQIGALIFMAGGVVLMIGGILGLLDSGSTETTAGPTVAGSTATTQAATVATASPSTAAASATSAAPSTTTTVPQTTTSTTEAETTTTTAPTTTTTTISDADLVEAFILEFAAALESGDVDFVFASLHPGIVFGFGTDLCRTWVETQIMGLSDYQQTGPLTGPSAGSLGTPGGDATFDVVYSAPVSFGFSGASFDANADFVVEDGTVYFTGSCEG